jgi:hypothetical protein
LRAAERHRVAEALPLADGDVRPVLPGPLQEADADRVEANDEQRPVLPANLAGGIDFFQVAEEVRVLHDDAERLVVDVPPKLVGIEEPARRRQRDDLLGEVGEVRG